jgi:hypothetical protein
MLRTEHTRTFAEHLYDNLFFSFFIRLTVYEDVRLL